MAKVVIKIDAYGQIHADAQGFQGTACEETTRKLFAGLAQEKSSRKKPEYNELAPVQQKAGGLTSLI